MAAMARAHGVQTSTVRPCEEERGAATVGSLGTARSMWWRLDSKARLLKLHGTAAAGRVRSATGTNTRKKKKKSKGISDFCHCSLTPLEENWTEWLGRKKVKCHGTRVRLNF